MTTIATELFTLYTVIVLSNKQPSSPKIAYAIDKQQPRTEHIMFQLLLKFEFNLHLGSIVTYPKLRPKEGRTKLPTFAVVKIHYSGKTVTSVIFESSCSSENY